MTAFRITLGVTLAAGWLWIMFVVLMLACDAQHKTMIYKAHHLAVRQ